MVPIPVLHMDEDDSSIDFSYDESPIEFAVQEYITDENDCPQFSVWMIVDETTHAPIYQYSAQQGKTFFSMQREFSDTDIYQQPSDEFWWSLKSYVEYGHDSDDFRKQLWDALPMYERGFFNSIVKQYPRMNLSVGMLMVVEYATDVFNESREDTTLDEYGGENDDV